MLKNISAAGCLIMLLLAGIIMATVFSLGMLGVFGPLFKDVNREITQHSQQYTEGKTQILLGLINDFENPLSTEGQKSATINEFCYQVTLLLPSERPSVIARFQAEHCN
jgi:hypothetical protein